ncbi:MAG: hypothetical protein LBC68_12705, partial [Prevotellaceae bacterium]|nr:hypothetical protein [Prevotellaceae bacterium]
MNNKPVVFLLNAHRLYAADSEKLYNDMRAYVKEHSGGELIIFRQSLLLLINTCRTERTIILIERLLCRARMKRS